MTRPGLARRALVLMTKPARPGRVKTRLIGRLSPEQAARLHGAFLEDLLERLGAGPFALRIAWALEADEPLPPREHTRALAALGIGADRDVAHSRQEGADLGQRLYRALRTAAGECSRVAAIGSDHPELDAAAVGEAFDRLDAGAEVVLGPAVDGGYYLIAVRREALAPALFEDIPWSTGEVLAATEAAAERLGLASERLAWAHDVDDAAALEALAGRLAVGDPAACPRTRALLTAWGMLAP